MKNFLKVLYNYKFYINLEKEFNRFQNIETEYKKIYDLNVDINQKNTELNINIANKNKEILELERELEVFKLINLDDKIIPIKKKKKNIPKALRRVVWNTWIGEDIGGTQCLCCKSKKISQFDFHCGHIISEKDGGETTVNNLKPICASCNLSMGSENMDDFIKRNGF
jgi:hypothetical protein